MKWYSILSLVAVIAISLAACSPAPEGPAQPPTTDLPNTEPVIVWERSGGIAGICQRLVIHSDGNFFLEDCLTDRAINQGTLPLDQREQLNRWLDQYTAHQWEFVPPQGSADMFMDRYVFNGRGSQLPTAEEQTEIAQSLEEIASEAMD